MRVMRRSALYACLMLAVGACFHQVVQTGLSPSSTVVEKPFVATWLWGLVPSNEVDARASCPSGVAVVETQQSFLNGVVGIITLGIFTPQDVRITCAERSAMLPQERTEITVAANATPAERAAAVNGAVEQAIATHQPVVLRY